MRALMDRHNLGPGQMHRPRVAQPGMAAATMASELSPRSVVAITGETADLSSVPDFTFAALPTP